MRKKLKNSSNTGEIVRVDASAPDPAIIRRAATLLLHGGVVVFPTSGLYGLGADAFATDAVDRVYRVKRRPVGMPLLVMVAEPSDLQRLVRSIPRSVRPLMELWPGGITLVFHAADQVPRNLTGGSGTIGVRIPAHPVARALVRACGGPITATSANLSGHAAPAMVADIDPSVRRSVDLVVDAGPLAGGTGSTILDVTCRPVRVIREGAVARQTIERVLGSGAQTI